MFQSCGQGFFIDEEVVAINNKLAQNLQNAQNYNTVAIPLELNLSEENLAYLNFLNKLSADIIDNPQIAKEFMRSPEKYLAANGIKGMKINFDEGMLRLVMMLADEEICKAIQSNDVNKFFSLCREKNLISTIQKSDIAKIKEIIENNRDVFKAIGNSIKEDGSLDWANLDGTDILVGPNVIVIPVAAAVVLIIGVLAAFFKYGVMANHWLASNTKAINNTVHIEVYGAKTTHSGIEMPYTNPDPYITQIWILKNLDLNSTYVMLNEYDRQQINELVNEIWKIYPEMKDSNIDKEKLQQFIVLNISKLYNFYGNLKE